MADHRPPLRTSHGPQRKNRPHLCDAQRSALSGRRSRHRPAELRGTTNDWVEVTAHAQAWHILWTSLIRCSRPERPLDLAAEDMQKVSVGRAARPRLLLQPEDQVAYGGRLRQERVMPGVELHGVACPSSEDALRWAGVPGPERRRGTSKTPAARPLTAPAVRSGSGSAGPSCPSPPAGSPDRSPARTSRRAFPSRRSAACTSTMRLRNRQAELALRVRGGERVEPSPASRAHSCAESELEALVYRVGSRTVTVRPLER